MTSIVGNTSSPSARRMFVTRRRYTPPIRKPAFRGPGREGSNWSAVASEIKAPGGALISTGWKNPGNGPPRWSCWLPIAPGGITP